MGSVRFADYLKTGRQNAMTAADVAELAGVDYWSARRGLKRSAMLGACMSAPAVGGAVYWLKRTRKKASVPREILGVWTDARIARAYNADRKEVGRLRRELGIAPAPRGRT